MAIKRQLLVFTRYYKGEEECPAHIKSKPNGEFYWDTERIWVHDSLDHKVSEEYTKEVLQFAKPPVPAEYGIPISLLGYIFHRLTKWEQSLSGCGSKFRDIILTEYLR